MANHQMDALWQRLAKIEEKLNSVAQLLEGDTERTRELELLERLCDLMEQRISKDYYSTDEAAAFLGKSEYTVREYCRLGRIQAEKRQSGRGKHRAWVISHEELQRVQREGLLPVQRGC